MPLPIWQKAECGNYLPFHIYMRTPMWPQKQVASFQTLLIREALDSCVRLVLLDATPDTMRKRGCAFQSMIPELREKVQAAVVLLEAFSCS